MALAAMDIAYSCPKIVWSCKGLEALPSLGELFPSEGPCLGSEYQADRPGCRSSPQPSEAAIPRLGRGPGQEASSRPTAPARAEVPLAREKGWGVDECGPASYNPACCVEFGELSAEEAAASVARNLSARIRPSLDNRVRRRGLVETARAGKR